jgi:UDP-N-acetylglucosamine 4-epimerase
MSVFDDVCAQVRKTPRTWLVTGAAGFIGSHLVEALLHLGQRVVGLDNLATGKRENLAEVMSTGHDRGGSFVFVEADIQDRVAIDRALTATLGPVDIVLHQAALGSVPRSIKDPLNTHRTNVDGFLTVLIAARDAAISRFVYASSSSVYGDHPALPKKEDLIGQVLSPYAATKRINEIYAHSFQKSYGLECIGLRYFNVFGPRQDKDGAYAAVIPTWVGRLLRSERCVIHGDGRTSRDFCFVQNVVQANILASLSPSSSTDKTYNIACGRQTTLNTLFSTIRDGLAALEPTETGDHRAAARRQALLSQTPDYGPSRTGDVQHSLADISLAREHLGFAPTHDLAAGLTEALRWYREHA